MCYCQHCQRNFKEFSGLEIPRTTARRERARQQFAAWQKKRLLELYTLWDAEIRKRNPDAAYFPNGFDQIQGKRFGPDSLCRPAVPLRIPVALAERQVRQGCPRRSPAPSRSWAFSASDTRRLTAGRTPRQNPNEVRLWAVDGIAQGFRPWVVKFNAKPLDNRWFKPVEDLYVWHWKNEKYLRNERPLARVGLVSAPQGGPRRTTRPGSTMPWWKAASRSKWFRTANSTRRT